MYFHTDDADVISVIDKAVGEAKMNDRRLRIDVDKFGRLRVKVGEGCWTEPFASTPDPYRDNG